MAGVYCPSCEAAVEPASKFCLSCGNDLTVHGPITATGHDLNQLKEVIRGRDDLSMAEKFDMIAKVEEGANPILLGMSIFMIAILTILGLIWLRMTTASKGGNDDHLFEMVDADEYEDDDYDDYDED